jgi:RecA/RadA recombinase
MLSLTPKEIINELQAWYDKNILVRMLGVSEQVFDEWLSESIDMTDNDVTILCGVFEEHTQKYKKVVQIKDVEQYVGNTISCFTPHGFVPARSFYKKSKRTCFEVKTEFGKHLTASYDHLIKTSSGFVKTGELEIGQLVSTVDGLEKVTETEYIGDLPVYDVEVMDIDHAIFTNDILSHNSGKSFLLTNCMKAAQDSGSFVLALDSENALDVNYLHRVGVSTDPDRFQGIGVVTVQDTVKVLSEFVDGYISAYGKYNPDAPNVLVCIDSLSMLLTEAENDNFEKGDQKGDQGQQAKQVKHFLKTMTSRMKMTNMSLACTAHVYNADPLKGEGLYSVTPSLRYACSQIVLITKLKLREDTKEKDVIGIKLRAETFKSRFSKLGSKIEIEVPYDVGLDPLNGLLDSFVSDDVIIANGVLTQV